jgi:hypothetical protein
MADGIKEGKKKTQELLFHPCTDPSLNNKNKKDLELVQIEGFPDGSRSTSIIRMCSLSVQACRSHLSAWLRCRNAPTISLGWRKHASGLECRTSWRWGRTERCKVKVCQLPLGFRVVPEFSAQVSNMGRLIKIYILGSW